MEYLPWRHTERERPQVPFLGNHLTNDAICSDAKKFLTWPVVQGWLGAMNPLVDILEPMQPLPEETETDFDCDEHPAMICQSWLFFSLVRVLSDSPFSLKDYVNANEPGRLDTQQLTEFLDQVQMSDDVIAALETARIHLLDAIEGIATDDACWDSGTFNVFWSTAMLHETLTTVIQEQGGELRTEHWARGAEIASILNPHDSIVDALRLAGKCPTLGLRRRLTLLETWDILASPLVPANIETEQIASHGHCTGPECRAFDTTPDTYQKRHDLSCEPSQHCRLVGIDTTRLAALVELHVIPLVRSKFSSAGLCIDIVDGGNIRDFTALSHVWAGGLGNFEANEIFECQAMFLHTAMRRSKSPGGTVYYWLDTLCIPVHNKDLRKAAIDEMARVYASARRMFVIDPVLRHTAARELSPHAIAAIVMSSPWMARSWTLQEAALAVELDFQFLDMQVSHRSFEYYADLMDGAHLRTLWRTDVDRMEETSVERAPAIQIRLLAVWQELSRRTSTKVEDLAAILAIFIDRSAGDILDLADQTDRVHALLASAKKIPTSLLFAPNDERCTGWCPQLPWCGNSTDLRSTTAMNFTEHGLMQLDDLSDLYVMRSVSNLPTVSRLVLNELTTHDCFEICLPHAGILQAHAMSAYDALFVFPRWAVKQTTASGKNDAEYPGVLFATTPRPSGTTATETARFLTRFYWKLGPCADRESSQPEDTGEESLPRVSVALLPVPHTDESAFQYRLTLDMGVGRWKTLSWSRKQYFPYIYRSIEDAKATWFLESVQYWPLACVFFLRLCFWVFATLWAALLGSHEHILVKFFSGLFVVVTILGLHTTVSKWQMHALTLYLSNALQDTWASSFSRQHGPRGRHLELRPLWIHMCISLAVSVIMVFTTIMLFQLHRETAMTASVGDAGFTTTFVLLLTLLLPLTDAIAFDKAYSLTVANVEAAMPCCVPLCLLSIGRTAILLIFLLQRSLEQRQGFTGSAYEAELDDRGDPRYDWRNSAATALFCLFCLLMTSVPTVMIAIMIATLLREPTLWEGSRTLYIFLIIVCLSVDILLLCFAWFGYDALRASRESGQESAITSLTCEEPIAHELRNVTPAVVGT